MKQIIDRIKILSVFFLALTLVGCEDDDDTELPKVEVGFTYTLDQSTGAVTFINTSTNVNGYAWDFGDETDSEEINPTKIYTANGTYTVILTASNTAGASGTFQDEITINVPEVLALPITFDGENVDYSTIVTFDTAFQILENPELSGANTTASMVGEIVSNGVSFQGVTFPMDSPVDFSGTDKTIALKLYSTVATNFLVKFSGGIDGARDVEVVTAHTGSGWEDLTFNFLTNGVKSFIDGDPENGQIFVPDGQYENLDLFVGFAADPGISSTFYLDDITQVESDTGGGFEDGLLINGDFENGGEGWIGNALNVVAEGGNSFNSANVEMAGEPFTVNLSQVVELTQGTNYILSFEASSDRARTILAGIGLNVDPFTNTAPTVNLTAENQTFMLQLSAADFGGADSRILFDMGADVGAVIIDNVSLVEGGDGSDSGGDDFDDGLLTNGDFEGGDDPWIGSGRNIVSEGGNSFNSVDVMVAGNAFDVNLSQVLDITQDADYILTFEASSDRSRTMVAGIGLNVDPFTNINETVNLTTDTQTFTLNLNATGFGGSDSRILFDMGADVGAVVIDNVSLVLDTAGSGGSGGCTDTEIAATTLPLDFEGCETFLSSQNFGAGLTSELSANPSQTGINTSDFVLRVDKPTGSEFFGGIQNVFPSNFDLTTTDTFKVKVYSTKANVVFRFELLANPNDGSIGNPAAVFATIPNANEWTEVEFTFINLPASPTSYSQLVIKPDNDEIDSAITEGGTYYLDDLILE